MLVDTWLSSIAFHLWPIWLQTLVAIYSESCQTSFLSFCAPQSEVAVLFDSDLSRRPFLGQRRRFRSTALHRIRFGTCSFVCMSYFTQKPMTDRMIERSDGRGFGRQQLLATSIEIFISHEKRKWLVAARYIQIIKIFVTLELSQCRKSGSTFSTSELVAARSDCRRLGNACVCGRPSDPPKLCRSAAPRARPLICSKTFDCRLE